MSRTLTVNLPIRIEKKHSVRFDSDSADAPISSLYVSRKAVAEMGNPKGLSVILTDIDNLPTKETGSMPKETKTKTKEV